IQLLGDAAGPISQALRLPDEARSMYRTFAEQNGQISPSPNILRVSPFANLLESEPNNDAKTATAISAEFPIALNGIIGGKGDVDFFRFKAKKNQVFDINVYA